MEITDRPVSQTFVLQDSLTGAFRPGRYSWAEAQAVTDGFTTIRRLDEVLAETGRA